MLSGPPLEARQDPLLLPDRPVAVYRTTDKFKFLLLLTKGFELCFSSLLPWESPYTPRTGHTNLHSEGRALALVFRLLHSLGRSHQELVKESWST